MSRKEPTPPSEAIWLRDMERRTVEGALWDIGQAIAALAWLADFQPALAAACQTRLAVLRAEYAAVEAMQRAAVKQTA